MTDQNNKDGNPAAETISAERSAQPATSAKQTTSSKKKRVTKKKVAAKKRAASKKKAASKKGANAKTKANKATNPKMDASTVSNDQNDATVEATVSRQDSPANNSEPVTAADLEKDAGADDTPVDMPEDGFVYILDDEPTAEPVAKPPSTESSTQTDQTQGAEQQLSGDNDDAFLILFDTDVPEDDETSVETNEAGECCVNLPQDIRLAKLNPMKDCLMNTLDAKSVVINAKQVKLMDTASFQLLWSYTSTLKEQDIPVEFSSASSEFTNSAKLLGINL